MSEYNNHTWRPGTFSIRDPQTLYFVGDVINNTDKTSDEVCTQIKMIGDSGVQQIASKTASWITRRDSLDQKHGQLTDVITSVKDALLEYFDN